MCNVYVRLNCQGLDFDFEFGCNAVNPDEDKSNSSPKGKTVENHCRVFAKSSLPSGLVTW